MIRLLLLLLILGCPVFANAAVLQEAERALAEDIPQVAVAKLKRALAKGLLAPGDRDPAAWLLAEAHLRAGSPGEALAILSGLPERADTASVLLRANAEAAAGQWSDAFRRYQELNEREDAPIAAALGEAESLQALGRTAEAIRSLRRALARRPFPPAAHLRLASLYIEVDRADDARESIAEANATTAADQQWQKHLEARILLLERNPRAAMALLESLLADSAGLSENLAAAATLAMAEARLALSGPDVAAKTLESFLRQHSENSQIELIFRRLDQIYAIDSNPTEGALHGFFLDFRERAPRVSALGQFYVTRLQWREKRFDRALKSLEIFLRVFPNHELVPFAYLMRGDIHEKFTRDFAAAEQAYIAASGAATNPEVRAEAALKAALINLQEGEYLVAALRLNDAQKFPRLKQTAAFNAALGWLMQENYERFREELDVFATQFQSPSLIGQLRLEEGLVQARNEHPDAMATLRRFSIDFPEHERRAEAQIAMAELAFFNGENWQARALLTAAQTAANDSPTTAQAEYLAVFLADKKRPRDPREVTQLARAFIQRHPQSPMVPEVRMKLGQIYFEEEDYLKAQEQFETLAASDSNGDYAEMALFLAGQCGMRLINTEALNHAIGLFDKVAERKGALETRARLQQAIIKNKLGASDDAVKIYDTIISASGKVEPEVRYAALIGKGDNLAALAQERASDDPLRARILKDAIETYDSLARLKDAPSAWANQAAYKKGKALQQAGLSEEALVEFYDVLENNMGEARETFWYAKAGFDAAGILEAQQKWKNAAAVYEKMALVPGAHVAQAKQRVKTLQLEHFLWD